MQMTTEAKKLEPTKIQKMMAEFQIEINTKGFFLTGISLRWLTTHERRGREAL